MVTATTVPLPADGNIDRQEQRSRYYDDDDITTIELGQLTFCASASNRYRRGYCFRVVRP